MSAAERMHSVIENKAKLFEYFGPPPVLKSENKMVYEKLLEEILSCVCPQDILELMLVQQFMDGTWENMRLGRTITGAINRRIDEQLQSEVNRIKLQKEKAAMRERIDPSKKPANELDRMFALEGAIECSPDDMTTILDQNTVQRAHSRALETAFDFCERLDKYRNLAIAKRNNAAELLVQYREPTGRLLRRTFDQAGNLAGQQQEQQLESALVTIEPTSEKVEHSLNVNAVSADNGPQTSPVDNPLSSAPENQNAETQLSQAERAPDPPTEPTQ